MHGGKGELTAAEIKENLPKEQESLTSDFVKNAIAHGASPGKIALANQLGKTTEELTEAEINDPKNKPLMEAATKYYGLAVARQNAGDGDNIDYKYSQTDGHLSDVQMRIARASGGHIEGPTTHHDCAASVQRDLADAGLGKWLGSGDAWAMGMRMKRSGEFVAINPRDAQPGDVVAWHDPSYKGHIETVKWRNGDTVGCKSDFPWNHNVNELGRPHGRFDGGMVLRYVGPGGAKVTDNS